MVHVWDVRLTKLEVPVRHTDTYAHMHSHTKIHNLFYDFWLQIFFSSINLASPMIFSTQSGLSKPLKFPHASQVHGWWERSHSSATGKETFWFHGYLLHAGFYGCLLAKKTGDFGLGCPHLCSSGVIKCLRCKVGVRKMRYSHHI